MMDFVFFVRTICLTLALVLLLQIKIGSQSLENHAVGALHASMISDSLTHVAHGGAKLIREGYSYLHGKISSQFK